MNKAFILSLFSTDKAESIKRYIQFITRGTPEEINKILGRRKLPSILGSKSFVDKIKGMFFTRETFEEIPESRSLAPDVNDIIAGICIYYKVKESDLRLSSKGTYGELNYPASLIS